MNVSKYLSDNDLDNLLQIFTPNKEIIEHFKNDLGDHLYQKMKGNSDTDFALALLAVHCEDRDPQEFKECFDIMFGTGSFKALEQVIFHAAKKI